MLLRESTAATLTIGPILDPIGAEYTAAVIGDISVSKNGTLTALASPATLNHNGNGIYSLGLTASNTNTLGRLQLVVNKSTYQMPPVGADIIPATVYDSLVLGTDYLQVDITQLNGNTQNAERMPISDTAQRTVKITGSNHIAASIHDSEPDSIPEGAFVTGAFSARVVGPNAIDAEALAADAVAEIRNGFGLASGNLDTQLSNIQSDTNDIQNRIPATLVDGRMSSHTGSISAGPVSEIQNGLAEQSTLLAVAGYVDTEMAAVKSVTDKLNTGLTQDGNVWQFTANMLELAPLSGDATLANQQTILTELDEIKTKTDLIGNAQAVTSLLAGAVLSPGTIVGFPEVLTVGDSYTISNGRAITVPVVDEDGNPIAQSGSLLFSNADVTFVIKRASDTESNRVLTCTATFVDPPGTGTGEAPYALIEIPAEETAKGLPKYQYSGILKFTWPGTADEVISFETSTITFDN